MAARSGLARASMHPVIGRGLARAAAALACGWLFLAPAVADTAVRDARIEALLGRMTLEEKIGQLSLQSNQPPFGPGPLVDQIAAGRLGGVFNFPSPADAAVLQSAARRSRLGVPLFFGADIVHGFRTIFPVPLGETASFDPALARYASEWAAREARAGGLNWTFAPVADLSRDPRWSRMVEGSGEDPLLGVLFTRARVEGLRAGGLATTLKHFVGYGAPAGGRDYDAASIDAADLNDNFLPPFRAGLDAGSESVMSGLHALNGVPATANTSMLTGLLRERWGFKGFVVSDWASVLELINHGVAQDGAEAARKALLAGIDMDMESRLYERHLPAEVRAGRVPESAIDQAVRRVLRVKLDMGLFEEPAIDPTRPSSIKAEEIRAAARTVAADTMVLLRNEGALPLAAGQRIAVIGGMAGIGRELLGPHAAQFSEAGSIVEAMRERAAPTNVQVSFSAGCAPDCVGEAEFDKAVAVAREADTIVAVLGEPFDLVGEAASRARLTLLGRQEELLRRLVETGKPVILVLLSTRPVELGPILDRLAGLVMAWFPGTEGAGALADILFGTVNPSAKLPITWPRTVGQVPLVYNGLPTGRPNDPDNRFTLRYMDDKLTPLFPFGYGLGYSAFAISDIAIGPPRLVRDATLQVTLTLANTGKRAGREVVQLYIRQPVASVSRPVRQLKAFEKVAVAPGESRTVTLRVPVRELGFHREDGSYAVEAGLRQIFVGTSSDAPLAGSVEIVE